MVTQNVFYCQVCRQILQRSTDTVENVLENELSLGNAMSLQFKWLTHALKFIGYCKLLLGRLLSRVQILSLVPRSTKV